MNPTFKGGMTVTLIGLAMCEQARGLTKLHIEQPVLERPFTEGAVISATGGSTPVSGNPILAMPLRYA